MKTFMAAIDDNNSSSSPSITVTSNGSSKLSNTRRSSIRSFESYDSVGSFTSSYNIANTNPSSSSSSSLGDATSSNINNNSTTITGNHNNSSSNGSKATTVSSHCLNDQDGISSTSSVGFISIRHDENAYDLHSRKSVEVINIGSREAPAHNSESSRSPSKNSTNRFYKLNSVSNVNTRPTATLTRAMKLNQSSSSKNSLLPQESTSQHQNQDSEKITQTALLNVAEMLLHGVADNEIIKTWLSNIGCEEYSKNFIDSGYDMPTLSRMTPQDLTAIGITDPTQRNRIQTEIKKLNLQDGIPNFKPPDLGSWLKLLRLSDIYYKTLCDQQYNTIEQVCQLTWEDFEEIGIQKLGHQKRLLLAIERVKEIESTSNCKVNAEPIYDTSPNQILMINGRTHQNQMMQHQREQSQQPHNNSNHNGLYDVHTLQNSYAYQKPQLTGPTSNSYSTMSRQHGKNPPPVPVRTNSLRSTTSPLLPRSNPNNKSRVYPRSLRYKTQCVSTISANNYGTLNRFRQRYSVGLSDSNSNIETIYDSHSDDYYHNNDNDTNSDTNSIKSLLISPKNNVSPQKSSSPSVTSMNTYSNNFTSHQSLPASKLVSQQDAEPTESLPTTNSYNCYNNYGHGTGINNLNINVVSSSRGRDEDFPPPPSPLPLMDSDEDELPLQPLHSDPLQPLQLNHQFSMMSIANTCPPPLPIDHCIPYNGYDEKAYTSNTTSELQQRIPHAQALSFVQRQASHQLTQYGNNQVEDDRIINNQASTWASISPFISPWPQPSN